VSLKRATGSHFCGGSVIKNNVVMCAAHCKQSTNSFTAGAGSASLNGQRQVLNIAQQIPHPSYDAQRIDWDYMVIKTATNFNFDNDDLTSPYSHNNKTLVVVQNPSQPKRE
jgi:V8-like Glu-specific endopeptidase